MALGNKLQHNFTGLQHMIQDISWLYLRINKCLYSGYLMADDVPSELEKRFGDFHEYANDAGDTCYRKTMGLHKLASEYVTRSIFAEEPEIAITNKTTEKWLQENFIKNDFLENEIELTETWVALGGKVKIPVRENGETGIDFIDADGFVPTQWKNKDVTGGVFVTQRSETIDGAMWHYTLLQWYEWNNEVPLTVDPETNEILTVTAGYFVKTEVYKSKNVGMFTTSCFSDLQKVFGIKVQEVQTMLNVEMPIFQYTKLPIKNNKVFRSPLGIGLMTNALDEEKASDESFDGLSVEIDFGRKKIAVGEPAQESAVGRDGKTNYKRFNRKKRAYLVEMDTTEPIVKDMSGELRTDKIVIALNTQLDIFAVKIGLSAGTFRFDGKSIVTATQIKTEQSESARTIRLLENAIARDWKQFIVKYIHFHNVMSGENIPEITVEDITITFHDNIIIDEESEKKMFIEEINAGISTEWEYRATFKGETDEDAQEFVEEWFGGEEEFVDEFVQLDGETEEEFVERFMNDVNKALEFEDEEQRMTAARESFTNSES